MKSVAAESRNICHKTRQAKNAPYTSSYQEGEDPCESHPMYFRPVASKPVVYGCIINAIYWIKSIKNLWQCDTPYMLVTFNLHVKKKLILGCKKKAGNHYFRHVFIIGKHRKEARVLQQKKVNSVKNFKFICKSLALSWVPKL